MSDAQRAQLIHIDVDRRLGHEWDEWDGTPLPNLGNYDSPPSLFFGWSALALGFALGVLALGAELLSPHVAHLSVQIPGFVWLGLGVVASVLWLWWGAILLSYVLRRPLLPERLAERGPFLRLMRLTSRVAQRFGKRDWVENAAVKVYNALVLQRNRKVGKGEYPLMRSFGLSLLLTRQGPDTQHLRWSVHCFLALLRNFTLMNRWRMKKKCCPTC